MSSEPQALSSPRGEPGRPFLLITIDVEGDNLWARRPQSEVRNALFLPRFQALCEAHGLRPTYLVDYDMARSPAFRDFGAALLADRKGEIGMHLHAWNTPPLVPLTAADPLHHPYLIEYAVSIMRDKIAVLTEVLEGAFGTKMRSHRAGRWALDARYARLLVEAGYEVDCSVTPHFCWTHAAGAPGAGGGPDYRRFPDFAYFVDPQDISRPGDSALLEVPMTLRSRRPRWARVSPVRLLQSRVVQGALNRLFPWVWLRPNGRNLADLLRIVRSAAQDGSCYLEFVLHSSELMPGGSPSFPLERDVDRLYDQLEALFAAVSSFEPATLTEYRTWELRRRFLTRQARATGAGEGVSRDPPRARV